MSGTKPNPTAVYAGNIAQAAQISVSASASLNFNTFNYGGSGLIACFTIHSLPGSASTTLALKIRGVDPATGAFFTLLNGAARSASGTTVMMVGPGISASALGVAALVPRDLNLLVSMSAGATSKDCVYSIGLHFTK